MTTYSLYDTAKGEQLLDHVNAEVIIKTMRMKEETFWRCVANGIMYRQRYEIIIDGAPVNKLIPMPEPDRVEFVREWAEVCAAVGRRFGWAVKWLEVGDEV